MNHGKYEKYTLLLEKQLAIKSEKSKSTKPKDENGKDKNNSEEKTIFKFLKNMILSFSISKNGV